MLLEKEVRIRDREKLSVRKRRESFAGNEDVLEAPDFGRERKKERQGRESHKTIESLE